jgi:diguanylate cyclase (GGDEF)-like protein
VDLAFRYGGDEFCVLAPSTEGEGGLQLCQRLADAFRDRSGRDMTFSMGVASVGPDSYCSPDELLRRADQAMYAAKRGPRHGGGARLRLAAKDERAEDSERPR